MAHSYDHNLKISSIRTTDGKWLPRPENWQELHTPGFRAGELTVTKFLTFLGYGYKSAKEEELAGRRTTAPAPQGGIEQAAIQWGSDNEESGLLSICSSEGCGLGSTLKDQCPLVGNQTPVFECKITQIGTKILQNPIVFRGTIDGQHCSDSDCIVEMKCPYGSPKSAAVSASRRICCGWDMRNPGDFTSYYHIEDKVSSRDTPVPPESRLKAMFTHYLQLQLYMWLSGKRKGKLAYYFPSCPMDEDQKGQGLVKVFPCKYDEGLLDAIGVASALVFYSDVYTAKDEEGARIKARGRGKWGNVQLRYVPSSVGKPALVVFDRKKNKISVFRNVGESYWYRVSDFGRQFVISSEELCLPMGDDNHEETEEKIKEEGGI